MKRFLPQLSLVLVACWLSSCDDPAPVSPVSEFRTFTSVDGEKIEGKLIKLDGNQVTLQRADGLTFVFPLETLSVADREFVKRTFSNDLIALDPSPEATNSPTNDIEEFSAGDPSVETVSPASPTDPHSLSASKSFILWFSRDEVENAQLASTSFHGDAAFVRTLKAALHRIVDSKGQAFVWETDYVGPQALVGASPMDGSQRYVVTHDAGVNELPNFDRYTLETPREEGSSLFLRFLFKSSSEVDLVFENQRGRSSASRGVVLRLPDLETKHNVDLYLLSPGVVDAKPNGLPKTHLSMNSNRVTLIKRGALKHGLRAIGSAGPLMLKLSVSPSEQVFYGSTLRPVDITNQGLLSFPKFLVKPTPEDPLTCELALFIDYMADLRKEFQWEITKLSQNTTDELATEMPMPETFETLEKFGGRTGYPRGNYQSGSGKGTYGPFMIDVVVSFFRRIHGYSIPDTEKLRSNLVLDPKNFVHDDLQYREFWKKICEHAKKEAFAPFGPAKAVYLSPFQKKAYDPKNLGHDIDRVIGTLRFLREAERAFGTKDQGISKMMFDAVGEIIDRDHGAVKKLYGQLIIHKATPEARAATPKYSAEWNKYLRDFAAVHAPSQLTASELRKAINCIEDADMVKAFSQASSNGGTPQAQLGPLKQWYVLLEKEMAKKDPRVVPQEYDPARKELLVKAYFHDKAWSLSLFRQGQVESMAELIRFK